VDADCLATRITNIAAREKDNESAHVFFADGFDKDVRPERDINWDIFPALKKANDMERFELTMDLFRVWSKGQEEEIRKVFGEWFVKYRASQLILTLATDVSPNQWCKAHECNLQRTENLLLSLNRTGDQLRVWYAPPAGIKTDNHVDSAGYGILLGIHGHSTVVQRYLEEILKICDGLAELRMPNGARFFVRWV